MKGPCDVRIILLALDDVFIDGGIAGQAARDLCPHAVFAGGDAEDGKEGAVCAGAVTAGDEIVFVDVGQDESTVSACMYRHIHIHAYNESSRGRIRSKLR